MTRLTMARALVARIEAAGVPRKVHAMEGGAYIYAQLEDMPEWLPERVWVPALLFGNRCAALKALWPEHHSDVRWEDMAYRIMVSADPLAEACNLVGIMERS